QAGGSAVVERGDARRIAQLVLTGASRRSAVGGRRGRTGPPALVARPRARVAEAVGAGGPARDAGRVSRPRARLRRHRTAGARARAVRTAPRRRPGERGGPSGLAGGPARASSLTGDGDRGEL